MNHRQAQRIYTQSALNVWLQHLDRPWEQCFSAQALDLGRTFYKRNIIRRVELTINEATIEAKHQELDFYCIITQTIPQNKSEKPSFHFRSSTRDKLLGESLAIAGLYEIEEMISNLCQVLYEEPSLPELKRTITKPDPHKPEQNILQPKAVPETFPGKTVSLALEKTIRLYLKATYQGLAVEPFWVENELSSNEMPVFSRQTIRGFNLSSNNRQSVIRLISQCRKAGFKFLKTQGKFLLTEVSNLLEFLKKVLPTWKKYYVICLSEDLKSILQQGIREARLWSKASINEDSNISLSPKISIRLGLKLDETILSSSEIKYVLKHPYELFLLPGRGLVHISKQRREHLAQLQESLNPQSSLAPYRLLSLFWEQPKFNLLEIDPALQTWHQKLLNPPTPLSLQLPQFLREYQQAGITWLWHLSNCDCHGLLADEMGLGKTLQILTLLSLRPIHDHPISLIVCPASVIGVWQKETEKFFPNIQTLVLRRGANLIQLFQEHIQSRQPLLLLSSYSQLRRHKTDLEAHTFAYIILDEAQFIKNPESKLIQAACALKAKHRFALTGTPIENRITDLWSIFRFLMPGLLGPRKRFEEQFKKAPDLTLDKIRKQLGPFILRRTKRQVLPDLPPKTIIPWACTLSQTQIHLYQKITESISNEFKDSWEDQSNTPKTSIQLLTALLRLRQVCIAPSLIIQEKDPKRIIEHSCKIYTLLELLEDPLASGHKVVVFSQFTQLLAQLETVLKLRYPEIKPFKLTGQTQNRKAVIDNFQNYDSSAIMLASLKAAGTGITLHSADYVFLMDPWWNPAVEEQAIDRVHRLGKNNPVFVYRLITQGTIEERIESLKTFKRSLSATLIEELPNITQLKHYFKSLHDLINYLPK